MRLLMLQTDNTSPHEITNLRVEEPQLVRAGAAHIVHVEHEPDSSFLSTSIQRQQMVNMESFTGHARLGAAHSHLFDAHAASQQEAKSVTCQQLL